MPTTHCLCMIVKDEAHVITRCLASMKPWIQYWVIVDTGSSDGTQDLIRAFMTDVPGELHERPWVNFGHNRSEALALARGKANYAWIMDADDFLSWDSGFVMPELSEPAYHLLIQENAYQFWRVHVLNLQWDWSYRGVLHEYPVCAQHPAIPVHRLPGVAIRAAREGNRSRDGQKYQRDVQLLEKGLRDEPENARYVFYLAQSHRDAGQWDPAIETYRRRVAMGGWWEERFYAQLQIGKLRQQRGDEWGLALAEFIAAHQLAPHRAEPLHDIAYHYRLQQQWHAAYLFARQGLNLPYPEQDILFVSQEIHRWRMADEAALAAYWTGRYAESEEGYRRLLEGPYLPEAERPRVEANLAFAEAKLAGGK